MINLSCIDLHHLYAGRPGRCGYVSCSLSHGIGIEVDGYDMGLATLGGHEGHEACACADVEHTTTVRHAGPCPE